MSAIDSCPACVEKRLHTGADWDFHPFAGHGYQAGTGWTHPDLRVQYEESDSPQPAGTGTSLNLGGGE
jgi:hypothetical protein